MSEVEKLIEKLIEEIKASMEAVNNSLKSYKEVVDRAVEFILENQTATKHNKNGSFEDHYSEDLGGGIRRKYSLKNGVTDGEYKEWWPSDQGGNLKIHGFYNLGKMDGTFNEYYVSGTLRSCMNYKNNLADGKQMSWYPDGKLHFLSECVDGKRQGHHKVYSENGSIIIDSLYENDVKVN